MNAYYADLHGTDPDRHFIVKDNPPDGVLIDLEYTQMYKIPIFIVYYGLFPYRRDVYLSATSAEYISDTFKFDKASKESFINAVNSRWNEMKQLDYYKDVLPDNMPDYSALETEEVDINDDTK